jgi:hypothetical protein
MKLYYQPPRTNIITEQPLDIFDLEQRRTILTWFQQMHAEGRLPEDVAWAVQVQCAFDPVSGEGITATTATYGCQLTFIHTGDSWVTGQPMIREDA